MTEERGEKIELQGGKGNALRYDFVDLLFYFILCYCIFFYYYYLWLLFVWLGYEIFAGSFAFVSVALGSILMPPFGFQAQRCLFWIVRFFLCIILCPGSLSLTPWSLSQLMYLWSFSFWAALLEKLQDASIFEDHICMQPFILKVSLFFSLHHMPFKPTNHTHFPYPLSPFAMHDHAWPCYARHAHFLLVPIVHTAPSHHLSTCHAWPYQSSHLISLSISSYSRMFISPFHDSCPHSHVNLAIIPIPLTLIFIPMQMFATPHPSPTLHPSYAFSHHPTHPNHPCIWSL